MLSCHSCTSRKQDHSICLLLIRLPVQIQSKGLFLFFSVFLFLSFSFFSVDAAILAAVGQWLNNCFLKQWFLCKVSARGSHA